MRKHQQAQKTLARLQQGGAGVSVSSQSQPGFTCRKLNNYHDNNTHKLIYNNNLTPMARDLLTLGKGHQQGKHHAP